MHQHVPQPQRRRRSDTDPLFDSAQDVEDRLELGNHRMDTIEESVKEIQTNLSEVLDIVRLGKSFFRLAGHFGAFVKWTTAIAAPLVALYFTWKSGKL